MCRLSKIYDFVYYEFIEPVMTHEENVMLDQHSLPLSLSLQNRWRQTYCLMMCLGQITYFMGGTLMLVETIHSSM
jgi:hypothetical protein